MWNLKNKRVNITKRNRLPDIESKLVVTSGRGTVVGRGNIGSRGLRGTNYYV